MKMSAGITSCCVALLLTLTSVSAVRRELNSIDDLRFVPRPGRVLLRWLANIVDIDRNNAIHLDFDPNNDYTSHHYGNYERVLNQPAWGFRYYTIGNIHKQTSRQLPLYVRAELEEENRARIIVSVREQNGRASRIGRVYITQHHQRLDMSEYDPEQTYEITANLLRAIRETDGMNTGMQLQSNQYDYNRNGLSCMCRFLLFLLFVVVVFLVGFSVSLANKK